MEQFILVFFYLTFLKRKKNCKFSSKFVWHHNSRSVEIKIIRTLQLSESQPLDHNPYSLQEITIRSNDCKMHCASVAMQTIQNESLGFGAFLMSEVLYQLASRSIKEDTE